MCVIKLQLTKSLLVNNGNYSIGLHTVITLYSFGVNSCNALDKT